ncbi:hypothetical protein F1654_09845 [Alkalicaulis satelles]|uniref:STAS/SEC14 domain-containing protein n=1 Tax=Alkalicaulis satelles TaxID=2609175 RepID=A0A5M6ZLH2_9PROT|nr:hypothetical protein [Alkalicaulis satelles]KAA5804068.1 hypothetical protein F1654_09845 [Alkalicaulis satelles]
MLKFRLTSDNAAAVDIRLEREAGLISFLFEGVVSEADLYKAQREAENMASGHAVRAMIVDVRRSSPGYQAQQLVEPLSAVLEDMMIQRLAFVSTRGRDDVLGVIEAVSLPYAVRIRAFEDGEDARAWVLGLS